MRTRPILLGALAVAIVACQSPRPTQAATAEPAAAGKDAPVAKIGAEVITAGELDKAVRAELADVEQKAYDIRKQGLDQLIAERLLGAKAKAAGLKVGEFLEKELARLDRFDAVILDDIGYVQQSREEMEVLFTFLSERYERRSVIITSNLVFKEWDKIFKDPMTTAAAIDRLIHHAVILEVTGTSYRTDEAKKRAEPATTTESAE